MYRYNTVFIQWALAHLLIVVVTPAHATVIKLLGDSIMAGDKQARELSGWGDFLEQHLDEDVTVHNLAFPGRSTKSFITEGDYVKSRQVTADYVLIGFGHNDANYLRPEVFTDPDSTFKDNLRFYIDDALLHGEIPVLVTPLIQWVFDQNGQIIASHLADYNAAIKAVAEEKSVPLLDLRQISLDTYNRLGATGSAHITVDNVHFTAEGAAIFAKILAPIIASIIDIVELDQAGAYQLKATQSGPDHWLFSQWLGWIQVETMPWYFHELGWLYLPSTSTNENFFIYSPLFGWLWTREDLYPYAWSYDDEEFYYFKRVKNKLFFYDFSQADWKEL